MGATGIDHRVRLGVIGAGKHAMERIYPCLPYLPVDLAAVCDLDESRARHMARAFAGEEVYTDHRKMLSGIEVTIDAVLICTGHASQPALAIDAMEAGYPVWTEAPPGPSAAHATAMLETSRRTGQICMTGFAKRFAPVYQRVRTAIASPEFGTPSMLGIDWSFGKPAKEWQESFVLVFGIHMIDMARYMFGEVDQVFTRERDGHSFATTLSFADGAIGTLTMTANRGQHVTEEVELAGHYGQYIKIDSSGRMIRYHGGDVVEFYDRPLSMQDSLRDLGYLGQLTEFVGAVREERAPATSTIECACRTMRLHDAIIRSARERHAVDVSDG
ncbi:Gfo/Idh/MocA family protein [Phytoactinopolyspora halotolerans]|uniref:Gfo/Idh/MocA family oxidoreductase n=1 Tax=Phytoactinopolyspora halotolerans TaxID=1981512 RepID=A0A6L9SFN4_9ACTN|nr:Gfo/Idh/MocA family oxidoreductase [Phytoactinopolyspora halotolerans]NEE03929.1 Gfo/Idh/MocA family oxidoreductase [Phytoactinopolyspora halotolerans]